MLWGRLGDVLDFDYFLIPYDVRHESKVLTHEVDSYNQSMRILMRMGVRCDLYSL